MTFTAAEKLVVIEFHLKAAERLESDLSHFEPLKHHADLLRAIADDYRKEAARPHTIIADQLEADIIDEASKVTAYIEWKDAQDAAG